MIGTRRGFIAGGCCAAAFAGHGSAAQFAVGGTATVTRLDLAKIDRERILTGAATALGRTPVPTIDPASEAFLQMTLDVPALAAASQIDAENDAKYAAKASATLAAWFNKAAKLEISGWEDLLGFAALAEVAGSLAFLTLDAAVVESTKAWFRQYLAFLTGNEEAGLARDAKDRNGSSWLLQVAALSKLLGDDAELERARVRYRHAELRAEINADGFFPGDLKSANPFRNSLMNLDMLAGVCVLGSTRFESLWDVELQDGPGMRAAVARHVPYMARPETWPYPADASHFSELPGRRPVLALAARAYAQPEYAALFLKLKDVTDPDLLRSMPIRQPLLWTAVPRRRS
jgi:hypothetical protein